jgi:hypothetical protein
MDDELFDDELELNERGADEQGLPRAAIASQPIRDGSRALLHDGYDVQLFHIHESAQLRQALRDHAAALARRADV